VMTALLFTGTLRNLLTTESGIRSDGVVTATFDMRRAGIPLDRIVDYQQQFIRRVAALPGVESVSGAGIVPMSGNGWNETVVIDGEPSKTYPNFNGVGPLYFKTLGIPLMAGRAFDEHDTLLAPRVAIVDESFARTFFRTPNPIGREFHIDVPSGEPNPAYRIVGVVGKTKYFDLREDFGPIAYLPDTQDTHPGPYMGLVIRPRGAASLTAALTDAARATHPEILMTVRTLDELIGATLVRERLMATLSGFFGVLAGLLAAVGLYGVLSYLVTRRRFEIGVRMALGAGRGRVLRMILRESAWLVGTGIAAGVGVALLATRWSKTLLFELEPSDPRLLAVAAVGLAAVATLASLIPARRASLVNPTSALRND
jgi:putative ABC transport system permease protein